MEPKRASAAAVAFLLTATAVNALTMPDISASSFEQLSPFPTTYVADTDWKFLAGSGSGFVQGGLAPQVLNLGCNAGDFAGFSAGDIALISRGTCTFQQKAANAIAAGAIAVLIYNNVNGLPLVSAGIDFGVPLLFLSQALGLELSVQTNVALQIKAAPPAPAVPLPASLPLLLAAVAALGIGVRRSG